MSSLRKIVLAAACGLSLAAAHGARAAAPSTDAPPTAAQIKACVATLGPEWKAEWKVLDIGAPRAPRNAFEAMNTSEMGQSRPGPGYPVHVVYVLNGQWTIDTEYFVIKNAAGRWQIPAVCTFP